MDGKGHHRQLAIFLVALMAASALSPVVGILLPPAIEGGADGDGEVDTHGTLKGSAPPDGAGGDGGGAQPGRQAAVEGRGGSPADAGSGGWRGSSAVGRGGGDENSGYWEDDFKDTKSIAHSDNIGAPHGDVTLKPKLKANDFEGDLTTDFGTWSRIEAGGTLTHDTNYYQSGSYSLLQHQQDTSHNAYVKERLKITLDFEVEALSIYNIADHSYPGSSWWAWCQVYFRISDGANTHTRHAMNIGLQRETPVNFQNADTANSSVVGADGRTWYCYNFTVPESWNRNAISIELVTDADGGDGGILCQADAWWDIMYALAGYGELSAYATTGNVTSVPISRPWNMSWDQLTINKTEPPNTGITVSVLNATGVPIPGLTDLEGTGVNLSGLDQATHEAIRLRAALTGDGETTPILHDWRVSYSNKAPVVINFTSSAPDVLRTRSVNITANCTDVEEPFGNLGVTFQYKYSIDVHWTGGEYLGKTERVSGGCQVAFSPDQEARLGPYDLRVKFNDSGLQSGWMTIQGAVAVLNNRPTGPYIEMAPSSPLTTDDIVCTIVGVSVDIDLLPSEGISYSYLWYRDDVIQEELTLEHSYQLTNTLPSSHTHKGEVWRCVVTPYDGIDNGTTCEANVTVLNSPPTVEKSLRNFKMSEDTRDARTVDLSKIFADIDGDALTYRCEGAVNIDVQIGADGPVVFTPSADWFGKETITFFANDSEYEVSDKLDVKVISVNDPPVIESVGDRVVGRDTLDFIIYEKEWSNISILCSDVDGNRLTLSTDPFDPFPGVESRDYYVLNKEAMAFELSLRPNNGMIGTYTINLTVKDSGGGKDHADVELTIVNVNDPPDTPVILSPPQGAALNATAPLILIGTCDDPDLHIPGSDEVLSFSWSSNMSGEIGTGAELTGQTLPPGVHMITLTVSDGELTSESHVIVTIAEPVSDEPEEEEEEEAEAKADSGESNAFGLIWVVVALLAVIAIVAALLLVRRRRKAREEEEAEQTEKDEGEGAGKEGAEGLRIQLPMAVPPPFTGAATAAPFPVAQLPQPPQVSGYLPPVAPTPATAAPSSAPATQSPTPSTVMPGAVATATAAPAAYQASLPLASPSAGPAAFSVTPNPYGDGQSPPTAIGYAPQQTGVTPQQVGLMPQQTGVTQAPVGLTPQQIGVAPYYQPQPTARPPLLLSGNTGSV